MRGTKNPVLELEIMNKMHKETTKEKQNTPWVGLGNLYDILKVPFHPNHSMVLRFKIWMHFVVFIVCMNG